jgi:hypothetical protein
MASQAEIIQDMAIEAAKLPQTIVAKIPWKEDFLLVTFKRDLGEYINLCAHMVGGQIPFDKLAFFFTKTVVDGFDALTTAMQNFPVETCGAIFPQLLEMYDSGGKMTGLDAVKKAEEPVEGIS